MNSFSRQYSELHRNMTDLLLGGGAAQVGIADLIPVASALQNHARAALHYFPRAVSFLVPFPRSVIAELLDGPTLTYLHYYRSINTLIDDLSVRVTALLEKNGHAAYPVPSSQRSGKNKLDSIFPHRIAAYQAGLGWIGKSGCLVNETYGPRVRLGTILTTAMFAPDQPVANQCGNCSECSDICPPHAIHGVLFSPDKPLAERLDVMACDHYQSEVRRDFGQRICGKCLAVCPFGKPL